MFVVFWYMTKYDAGGIISILFSSDVEFGEAKFAGIVYP